jgi:hypothetical protein
MSEEKIKSEDSIFVNIGKKIGQTVYEKNLAYGDSFSRSDEILKVLYPDGVRVDQYRNFLMITRIIDKLFRIATSKDAFGENPAMDIAGYGILSVWKDIQEKKEKKELETPKTKTQG